MNEGGIALSSGLFNWTTVSNTGSEHPPESEPTAYSVSVAGGCLESRA